VKMITPIIINFFFFLIEINDIFATLMLITLQASHILLISRNRSRI
jgi:hypothetical protein